MTFIDPLKKAKVTGEVLKPKLSADRIVNGKAVAF
jgi:hypothetical protein